MTTINEKVIIGCLVGTAIGDALGLPMEGISKQRQKRLFKSLDKPRLIFGHGMVSDDSEHACMVAQALSASSGNETDFERLLARQIKAWLLSLPAGIGMATLKASLKLLFGVSPAKSGVYSAGNGPCMRSPIIGVCFGHDRDKMLQLIHLSSRITHTDPKAEAGAITAALAAHYASRVEIIEPALFLDELKELIRELSLELYTLICQALESASKNESTEAFASRIGCSNRVSGYTLHTMPVVIQAWLSYSNDYRAAVETVIRCGGDTDTTAAIVGAIVGARVGIDGIPEEWKNAIIDYPRSLKWIEKLGGNLAEAINDKTPKRMLALPFLLVLIRNVFFAGIVLYHGFRRLLPPY